MVKIGKLNLLSVVKKVEFGAYLDGGDDGEILIPNKEGGKDLEPGDQVEVFIYHDSEDRLIATMQKPLAMVGDFAVLKVAAVERVGAFLNWGLQKDLFLPFAEQSRTLKIGQDVVVFIYLDKSSRISASMRLERNTDKTPPEYAQDQEVNLLIIGRTDLGYKAIIEGKHLGVLYENEVFQDIKYGQSLKGFIKKLRPDGKIDLMLNKTGHHAADDVGPAILKLLKEKGGFLALDDKTPPAKIYQLFGVSKKKFKIALGGLYKKRLIRIDPDGIRLV